MRRDKLSAWLGQEAASPPDAGWVSCSSGSPPGPGRGRGRSQWWQRGRGRGAGAGTPPPLRPPSTATRHSGGRPPELPLKRDEGELEVRAWTDTDHDAAWQLGSYDVMSYEGWRQTACCSGAADCSAAAPELGQPSHCPRGKCQTSYIVWTHWTLDTDPGCHIFMCHNHNILWPLPTLKCDHEINIGGAGGIMERASTHNYFPPCWVAAVGYYASEQETREDQGLAVC